MAERPRLRVHRAVVAAVVLAGATATAAPPAAAAPAGTVFTVAVAGHGGIPDDAAGVAVNVTATNTTGDGYLTVYPCDSALPTASNVNYRAGESVANLVVADLDAAGQMCVFTSAGADVIIDLAGWFAAGAGIHAITPIRAVDTRTTNPLGAAGTASPIDLAATGVPAAAAAAIVNVTATNTTGDGHLTVFPCGEAIPATSNINYTAGRTVPGLVFAGLAMGSAICVSSYVITDIIVDVAGWLDPTAFTAVSPTRLADTRTTAPVTPGVPLEIDVGTAGAVALNVTATNTTGDGYLTVYPCGGTEPVTSNVNYAAGQTTANLAVVAAGGNGRVCISTFAAADVIVDLFGRFPVGGGYVAISPVRLYDSRTPTGPGPVTAAQLLGAPVPSLCGHPAGTLVDGQLPGIPPFDGVVTLSFDLAHNLDPDLVAFGDLTGDGVGDAAAVLYCNRGGVSWPETIQLYGPGPTWLGGIVLGDHVVDYNGRASVYRVWYEAGSIRFEWHTSREGDLGCCGTLDASARAGLTAGTIVVDDVVVFDELPALNQLTAAVNAGDEAAALAVADPDVVDTLVFWHSLGWDLTGPWSCRGVLDYGINAPPVDGDRVCQIASVTLGLAWTGFAQWRAVDVLTEGD